MIESGLNRRTLLSATGLIGMASASQAIRALKAPLLQFRALIIASRYS